MRILFLDDDPVRQELFRQRHQDDEALGVSSVHEAFPLIHDVVFDEVWLDHDLNDFTENLDWSGAKLTGADVALWITQKRKPGSFRVVIHSWNDDGAAKMAEILKDFNPVVEPFDMSSKCDQCGSSTFMIRTTKTWHCLECERCPNCLGSRGFDGEWFCHDCDA